MPRRKDIWRCAIAAQPIGSILSSGIQQDAIHWFPEEPPFTFLADPFGYRSGENLHVFVEQYDYRTRHGIIERLTFDAGFELLDRRPALREPWHLSYPFVFDGEGATWMLPEAHRSGRLTLYRAFGMLEDWRPECVIELDCVPVDASILSYGGRWWLFYASAASKAAKLGSLHVAWSEKLCGPWTLHPDNPVRRDFASARPGGTPEVIDGRIMLPTQDCERTYGGGIRPLWIDLLDETGFAATRGETMAFPPGAPAHCEGMHTLSACGDVTLFDVKTIDRSLAGIALDVRRFLGRSASR
ncbi:glucosamine inositolphosphorylceramide transferase family protein [Novosphingobium sp.]|uniref:glucosamine inositolphosphorylceramide transferase family protein n=1 Tax=Novosphingobium sp. TaxID=1874826 RepID=UPI002FDB7CBB